MGITTTRNVDYVLVGGSLNTATVNNINDLQLGEVGVLSVNNATGSGLSAGDSFVIAIGGANSKPAFVSEAIPAGKVTVAKSRGLEVAVEQQDSIGFSGAGGAIDAGDLTANNLYMVDVMIQEYLTSNTDGRYIKHFQYQSGSSTPNSDDVTHNLTKSAIENFSREAEDYIGFQHLIRNAGSAVTGATTLTFTKGSKTVVGNVAASNVAVGDYVRVSATLTDSVYKVVGASGVTLTLDYPFQEATNASTTSTVVTALIADTADTGILMTAKPLSFVVGKKQYKKARWELILNGFDVTVSQRDANAYKGIGTYEQASEAEWFARGFEGEYFRMGEPVIYDFSGNATSGITYDVTTIRWVEDSNLTGLGANPASPKQITIYSPNGVAYMTKAIGQGGVWLQMQAAVDASKLSHRDTGDTSDSAGTLVL